MQLTRLTVTLGAQTRTLDDAAEPFRIGGGPDNDFVVADPRVAEHHLTIDHEGPAWVVRAVDGARFYSGSQPLDAASIPTATTLSLGAPDGPVLTLTPAAAAPVASGDAGLYLRTEEGQDRVFPTDKAVVVGSDPACDFIVEDALVAPQHVRFEFGAAGWTLADLGSSRGTYVDGRRVTGPVSAAGSFVVHLAEPRVGPELAVITAGEHATPRNRAAIVIAAIAGLALVIALVVAVVVASGDDDTFPPLDEVSPSVVYLECTGTEGDKTFRITGSGTVIDDGLILTNYHVAAAATECGSYPTAVAGKGEDRSGDEPHDTELLAFDKDLDLAVLRVKGDFGQPSLEIGKSDDIATGDRVRILGYPGIGGASLTVTDGIVSGRASASTGDGPWIKTDAAIAGGNSGGTAIDTKGRLIGVPTAGAYLRCATEKQSQISCDGYSLGFLRPIDEAADVIAEAKAATSPIPVAELKAGDEAQPGEGDAEDGSITNPRFGGSDAEDAYIAPVDGVLDSSQSPNACLWFDGVGVPEGTTYDLVADIPGEQLTGTLTDANGGSTKGVWCITGPDDATPPAGSYKFTATITGRPETAVEVSGTYR